MQEYLSYSCLDIRDATMSFLNFFALIFSINTQNNIISDNKKEGTIIEGKNPMVP